MWQKAPGPGIGKPGFESRLSVCVSEAHHLLNSLKPLLTTNFLYLTGKRESQKTSLNFNSVRGCSGISHSPSLNLNFLNCNEHYNTYFGGFQEMAVEVASTADPVCRSHGNAGWTGMKNAASLTMMWRFRDKGHVSPSDAQTHVWLLVMCNNKRVIPAHRFGLSALKLMSLTLTCFNIG